LLYAHASPNILSGLQFEMSGNFLIEHRFHALSAKESSKPRQ
jgi:hypothetical protein